MKMLTVPSSNSGRSIGDVFLALFSTVHLTRKSGLTAFLTHTNHAEIVSFFRKSLDLILLSDAAEKHAGLLDTVNIHWNSGSWAERYPDIHNPWRYFLMNGIAPSSLSYERPKASARIGGKSIVIFPERSDNGRLDDGLFADFIGRATARGYTVYTNCYINSNYVTSPAMPGTTPLAQLSLGEMIAIASEPSNILVGTRSGLFDVLYFVLPKAAARLLILYPPDPAWLWDAARFQNETMREKFPQFYVEREGVVELRTRDFNGEAFTLVAGE
jgi:hypothetical protein